MRYKLFATVVLVALCFLVYFLVLYEGVLHRVLHVPRGGLIEPLIVNVLYYLALAPAIIWAQRGLKRGHPGAFTIVSGLGGIGYGWFFLFYLVKLGLLDAMMLVPGIGASFISAVPLYFVYRNHKRRTHKGQ